MTILYKIIMLMAGAYGVWQLLSVRHRVLRPVLFLLILGIALSLALPTQYLTFLVFYLGALAFAVYAMFIKHTDSKHKTSMLLIAIPVFIHGIFATFGWPYVYQLKFLQIIPLLVFFAGVLPNRASYKREMAILVILAADALIQVIILLSSLGS